MNHSNFSSDNLTELDLADVLQRLNNDKVLVLLPVIILVILMMIAGIVGNILVCIVYIFKMKRAPSHYFILYLAILDLVSCCIGMPSELGDLLQPLTFPSADACRFLRFVLSFTVISSSTILICVAFDRYYKICKPLKSFPIRKVQKLCLFSFAFGAAFSWPAVVIYGIKITPTTVPGLDGKECSISDKMKGKPYPLIYYATLIGAFVVTFMIFVSLYVKIGREINRRRTMFVGNRLSPEKIKSLVSEKESTTFSDDDSKQYNRARKSASFKQIKEHIIYYFRSNIEPEISESNNGTSSTDETVKRRRNSTRRYLRTTYIFLSVFIAFLISFVPYLVVNILRFSKVAFTSMNSGPEEVVYNLCVRSYFISNFINPIVYSLLNKTFRKECRRLCRKCRI